MILRSPTENENADSVMPAWIAGIQIRKEAYGDIRVSLDSSAPCWNDATGVALPEVTEVPLCRIFKGGRKDHEVHYQQSVSALCPSCHSW